MSQSFGQYVRSLREQAGLTQRALSQVVGFRSLAHLSDIESGKRYPSRETLPKFAGALGVSVEELESRDVRGPVEALKTLFAAKPEMVGVFLKLAEAAQTMDADELVARITRPVKVPSVPAAMPAPPPPVAPKVEPPPAREVAPSDGVPAATVVEVRPYEHQTAEPPKPVVKKAPASKPDDHPTLF